MTEKRFKVETIEEELYPMPIYYDGDKELNYDEIADLLNELYEKQQSTEIESSSCHNTHEIWEDIQKFVDSIEIEEVGEGRFQEIVSTQKIVDTRTGKEYDGMVDVEVLRLMNDVDERNQRRKEEIVKLKHIIN